MIKPTHCVVTHANMETFSADLVLTMFIIL